MDRALGFVFALNPFLVPPAFALVVLAPAFMTVCWITARRTFAPLVRGSLERTCVLIAAGIAATSIVAQVTTALFALARCDGPCDAGDAFGVFFFAWCGFFLLGPPSIAAAAWVAGEMLSGPSLRREPAFAAAAVAAYAAGVAGFAASVFRLQPGASLAAAAAASALAATAAYLATRGPTPAR
jgi:hypothetical protein